MASNPWLKFYPADWRSDPRLRMCSLAARGLWIEMIALMHEADPYGHLIISGNAPTDAQLAVLAGTLPDQIPGLLGELESAGVFSRTQKGVVFSRRMTRDEKKARLARKNGKSGGNPSLGKQREISPSVNPPDKPPDKLRNQKPDTRSQIKEGKARKRASRLAEDWKLPEDWKTYATANGLSSNEADQLAAELHGWSLTKPAGTSLNWERTWQTWVRKHRSWNPGKTRAHSFDWTQRIGAA